MGDMSLYVIHSVKFHGKYNGLARYSKEINNKKLIVATNFLHSIRQQNVRDLPNIRHKNVIDE